MFVPHASTAASMLGLAYVGWVLIRQMNRIDSLKIELRDAEHICQMQREALHSVALAVHGEEGSRVCSHHDLGWHVERLATEQRRLGRICEQQAEVISNLKKVPQ